MSAPGLTGKRTVGDLMTSGRILDVERKSDPEYRCLPKKVVDLTRFPKSLTRKAPSPQTT